MLKTRLIPCMLFNGFSLVKTIQFERMRNLGSPVQMARVYNSRAVDELMFIDLAATVEGRAPLYDLIQEIVQECFVPLTVGGGIHAVDDIQRLLSIGADKVSINSEALVHPDFINAAAARFGSQCIVVSIDAKRVGGEHYVFTERGRKQTQWKVTAWAREVADRGAGEIVITSVDRDGTMSGYDLELTRKVVEAVPLPVIANGGAGKVQDIVDVIQSTHASAASLASMFHYSGHTANSIKERMQKAGIPVRILR